RRLRLCAFEEPPVLISDLTESLQEQLRTPLGMGAVILVGAIVVFILAHFSGRIWYAMFAPPPKEAHDPLLERLDQYPPAPGKPASRRTGSWWPVPPPPAASRSCSAWPSTPMRRTRWAS